MTTAETRSDWRSARKRTGWKAHIESKTQGAVSPHSHFSCLSLSISLSRSLSLFLSHSASLFYSTISLYPPHIHLLPGTPCEPPWIRDVTLLFCSLLFLPLSLLTLATERRVLVCSCCFFDTFIPSPRFAAEEWGLEVKQVWLTS